MRPRKMSALFTSKLSEPTALEDFFRIQTYIDHHLPKMFSLLQKPQESVNAEDLETLQNEIEKRLVDVVIEKWDLQRELNGVVSASPDTATSNSNSIATKPEQIASGKLRNSLRLNHASENSSDGFKANLFGSSANGPFSSAPNSTEDSVSSESSLVSSLTVSTIITSNINETNSQPASTTSSSKRGLKSSNDRPSKRFRQNSSNSTTSTITLNKRPTHSKHRTKIIPSKYRNSCDETHQKKKKKKKVNRNEAPDKLWPFVDQFCATPTESQLMELDEMIQDIDNDREYFKIPTFVKKESNSKDSPVKSEQAVAKGQKKPKSRLTEEEPSLGALTQRLVSSFIEESDDLSVDNSKSSNESSSQSSKKKNTKNNKGKNIDMNNAKSLEKRIRQELEEHEILETRDEIPYTSEEDENLRELVACQQELLSIQRQNKNYMIRSLQRAKQHLELEKEREQLREANSEVVTAYHRLIQARQKKRNPTKKEKDAASKALKIQDAIFKRCDDLYLSTLNRSAA